MHPDGVGSAPGVRSGGRARLGRVRRDACNFGPMSSEDRRRLSREMMDRIDAVVSGHDLQRSSEGGMHVDDGPLLSEDEMAHLDWSPMFRASPDGRFSGYMSTRPHGFLTAAVRHAEAEERVAEIERTRERYYRNPDCSKHRYGR